MSSHDEWRSIIASALDWEQAHAKFDSAVEGLAPEIARKAAGQFSAFGVDARRAHPANAARSARLLPESRL